MYETVREVVETAEKMAAGKRLNVIKRAIVVKLMSDDNFVCWALRKMMSYQTNLERNNGATLEWNKIGFNKRDAKFLTEVYAQGRFDVVWPTKDTPRSKLVWIPYMDQVRMKLIRYRKQLAQAEIARRGEVNTYLRSLEILEADKKLQAM